jgi:hypothetical protein
MRLFRLATPLILALSLAEAAHGQTAPASAPDKSGYTLFDPTPDDQLRAFCTDRPPKANLPCAVDAGHFQYEADIFNGSQTRYGGVTTNVFLYANPTLKLGLTNTIDFELNMAPVETVATHGALVRQTFTGNGDLFLRTKFNLAGAEGGDFQAAAIPYVKAPTAAPGIGNGAVEGGVIAPVSFALPKDFTLLFDPEFDDLRNAANTGHHANYQFLANLSHPLPNNVTAYLELWGQINDDPGAYARQASFDLTMSWIAWDKSPNLQFDAGVFFGLTPATPKIQAFVGVSQRF